MKKHTMNPVDEKIIIKKLKAGDNEAYKYLYDYHYVALCKLSYYMLKDKIQAESIVSDVIFHLWEIRENLELVPPLRNYLIIAVRNKCLNYLALKQQEVEAPLHPTGSPLLVLPENDGAFPRIPCDDRKIQHRQHRP